MSRSARPSTGAQAPAPDPTDPHAIPERRVFRVAAGVAVAALLAAVAANWSWAPGVGEPLAGPMLARPGVPMPASFEPAEPAVSKLPERIIQYETMTRQAIPGQGDRAAEAIYNTLQMGVESQAPTTIYARVEAFASPAEAGTRLERVLQPYATGRTERLLGNTKAVTGYSADRGALVTAWARGGEVTFVKTSFREFVPAQENRILERLHEPVVDAVDIYQRTGRQGVSK